MGRATVEEFTRLDITELAHAGLLNGDDWSAPRGRSIWLKIRKEEIFAEYQTEIGLRRETLPLARTRCHFGGSRTWFRCPTAGCARRCGVLYRAGNRRLACRRCHGLAYRTQHEQPDGRLLLKAERIWRRLGCAFGDEPKRPKGMHRRTFQRLADTAAAAYMGSFNTGRLGRLLAKADRRTRS